ncbi:MAG: hypothetical protein ABI637_02560 [Gemmatimonadota bacterium]
MSEPIRVFVNEQSVDVGPGSTVARAVRIFDSALADRLDAGQAYVTDGRGVPMPADVLLSPGAILRVVVTARRGAGAGDAHA